MFGRSIVVKGEVRSSEDLTIEGRVDGPILLEDHALVIAESAHVAGDVVARDITVFGRASGQLVATEVVDVRASAEVSGRVVSRRFILDPEATFTGRVEPQHLEAAISVARFEQRKRDGSRAVEISARAVEVAAAEISTDRDPSL
jgi:cytoskeletal protein CcmA (bactofilin family)